MKFCPCWLHNRHTQTYSFTLFCIYLYPFLGFPGSSAGKETDCNAGDPSSIPGLGRSPAEGRGPTPVFWPGESQGQRSLVGYSPWGRKELDRTEWLSLTYISIFTLMEYRKLDFLRSSQGNCFFSHVKTGICKNITEETNYLLDYDVNKLLESEGFLRVLLAKFASKLEKKTKLCRENIYRQKKNVLPSLLMYLKNINKSMTNLPFNFQTCLVVAAWKNSREYSSIHLK